MQDHAITCTLTAPGHCPRAQVHLHRIRPASRGEHPEVRLDPAVIIPVRAAYYIAHEAHIVAGTIVGYAFDEHKCRPLRATAIIYQHKLHDCATLQVEAVNNRLALCGGASGHTYPRRVSHWPNRRSSGPAFLSLALMEGWPLPSMSETTRVGAQDKDV